MGRSRYGYQAAITALLLIGISSTAIAQDDAPDFNRCAGLLQSASPPSSVAGIFAELKRSHLSKSEYESSTEYAQRMAKLSFGRQISLVTRVKATSGRYDADNRKLTYSKTDLADAMGISAVDDHDRSKFTYAFDSYASRDAGSYIGQNAFGARTRVTAATRSHHYVEAFDSNALSSFEPILLDMSPAEAKTSRNRLEWIAMGTIDPSTYRKSEHYYGATIDDPSEISETDYLVTMKTVCVGLRDAKTHKLLGAFPALPSL